MSRPVPAIILTKEEESVLKATANSRTAEFRQVERANIILACAADKENKQVSQELGISLPTVSKWRERFAEQRLPGLRDSERTGRPPQYGIDFRNLIV